jgi:hypothetical protein
MKRSIVVITAIVAIMLLAGCREEERGHPLVLDKGNYTGPADSQLNAQQLSELNNRVALQGTANVTTGAAVKPTEERPAPPTSKALDQRLQEQVGTAGK